MEKLKAKKRPSLRTPDHDAAKGMSDRSMVFRSEPDRHASNHRGPHSTRTLLRKSVYFDRNEWKAIEERCFQADRGYGDLVRDAVRFYLRVGVPQ